MTPLWTAAAAAAATGGQFPANWQATGVSIDTRTLAKGDLFVALKDIRDGHDFVALALEKGAAAALVSRIPEGVAADAPLLLVPDVQTSTKEMLRTAFTGQARLHAAEASYNNHWGVPLTLARMPIDTEIAIIEIGMNHPGEIAPLSRLARPHIALITTVAPAHLEADYRLTGVQTTGFATIARAQQGERSLLFKLATPGKHFAANALAVLATGDVLGCDPMLTVTALGRWSPPTGRGTLETILLDPVENLSFGLIDDAFNANPASVAAALDLLAACQPTNGTGRVALGRRIAILGDMLELGPTETALHADIARHPALARIALVHCVGPRMKSLHHALPRAMRGNWAETAEELAPKAHHLVDAGDIVLVKGSKGSKVSRVVDALRKLGQPGPSDQGTD